MKHINPMDLNRLLVYLKYSYDLLLHPIGIIFFLFTIISVCIAVFSWPKRHIRNFFIVFPFLFVSIILLFYHEVRSPSTHPIEYIQGAVEMLPFGVGYGTIYIIFYWISVGIAAICSLQKPSSKFLLCIFISVVLWSFAKFWFSLATYITLVSVH